MSRNMLRLIYFNISFQIEHDKNTEVIQKSTCFINLVFFKTYRLEGLESSGTIAPTAVAWLALA